MTTKQKSMIKDYKKWFKNYFTDKELVQIMESPYRLCGVKPGGELHVRKLQDVNYPKGEIADMGYMTKEQILLLV